MSNLIEILKKFNIINKIFDCFRLVDMDFKNIVEEYCLNPYADYITRLDYKFNLKEYKKCLEIDKVIYRIKQYNNYLLFFSIVPVCINNKNYILECVSDISESVETDQCCKVIESSYKLSITDELTGVYNRRYINYALPEAVGICSKNKIPLSVIFADLDFFKDINDLYGHATGDYLLSEFANDLQLNIRENVDWVARYGGDEFLLCLIGADREKAMGIAERIREVIEDKTLIYNGNEIKSTCSLGVYTVNNFKTIPTFDLIINEVDKNLYKAKSGGRNKVH